MSSHHTHPETHGDGQLFPNLQQQSYKVPVILTRFGNALGCISQKKLWSEVKLNKRPHVANNALGKCTPGSYKRLIIKSFLKQKIMPLHLRNIQLEGLHTDNVQNNDQSGC